MSKWNHLMCRECYAKREPDREPAAVQGDEVNLCCDCGKHTGSGIYYREKFDAMPCGGEGGVHVETVTE